MKTSQLGSVIYTHDKQISDVEKIFKKSERKSSDWGPISKFATSSTKLLKQILNLLLQTLQK